jgi:hypothetical protein
VHTTNRDLGQDVGFGVACVGWIVVTVRVTTLRGAAAGVTCSAPKSVSVMFAIGDGHTW